MPIQFALIRWEVIEKMPPACLKLSTRDFSLPPPLVGEEEGECPIPASISLGGGALLDSSSYRARPRLERGNDEGKPFRPRKSQTETSPTLLVI